MVNIQTGLMEFQGEYYGSWSSKWHEIFDIINVVSWKNSDFIKCLEMSLQINDFYLATSYEMYFGKYHQYCLVKQTSTKFIGKSNQISR